jgi:hypothetical protein
MLKTFHLCFWFCLGFWEIYRTCDEIWDPFLIKFNLETIQHIVVIFDGFEKRRLRGEFLISWEAIMEFNRVEINRIVSITETNEGWKKRNLQDNFSRRFELWNIQLVDCLLINYQLFLKNKKQKKKRKTC